QVLRARVLRGLPAAEVEVGPGGGAQRALGRGVHEDGLEHAAGAARPLLRGAHERLDAPAHGPPDRDARRVVKSLRSLRGYLFTIVGVTIGVAGLVSLGAMSERIVRFIEGGDRFVLGQISGGGRGVSMAYGT